MKPKTGAQDDIIGLNRGEIKVYNNNITIGDVDRKENEKTEWENMKLKRRMKKTGRKKEAR